MDSFRDVTLSHQELQPRFFPENSAVSIPNIHSLTIESDSINGNSFLPIRTRISPSGYLNFVIGMFGEVVLLQRHSYNSNWIYQPKCILALNLFNGSYAGERSLISVIINNDFDEHSSDETKRYIFLNYSYQKNNTWYQGVGRTVFNYNKLDIPLNLLFSTYHNVFKLDANISESDENGWYILNSINSQWTNENNIYLKYNTEYHGDNYINVENNTYKINFKLKCDIQEEFYETFMDEFNYSFFNSDTFHENSEMFVDIIERNSNYVIFNINTLYTFSNSTTLRFPDLLFKNSNSSHVFTYIGFKDINITDHNNAYCDTFSEIYTFGEENISNPGGAHQITDGFIRDNILYILQGDGFDEGSVQDITSKKGKIISMDMNGNNQTIVVKGVRNELTLMPLEVDIDIQQRVLGIGNGHNIGRLWFAPIPKPEDGIIANFGWGKNGDENIEDDNNAWRSFTYTPDPNNPIISPDGILRLFSDDPSPNGLAVAIINEKIILFLSFFGKVGSNSQNQPVNFERSIWACELINLGNQPSILNLQKLLTPDLSLDPSEMATPLTLEFDKFSNKLIYTDLNWNSPLIGEISFQNFDFIIQSNLGNNKLLDERLLEILKEFIIANK